MAMDELALEAFERRAKEAEERLARIEKQVSSNAGGGGIATELGFRGLPSDRKTAR